jgi:hypothetical protein
MRALRIRDGRAGRARQVARKTLTHSIAGVLRLAAVAAVWYARRRDRSAEAEQPQTTEAPAEYTTCHSANRLEGTNAGGPLVAKVR